MMDLLMRSEPALMGPPPYAARDPRDTVWGPETPPALTRSASQIQQTDFDPDARELHHSVKTHTADLLAGVWYRVELRHVPDDVYGLLESVTFTIGGQVIEQYSGYTLQMLSTFDKKASVSVHGSQHGSVVIFPLRLCTSVDTHLYLPLCCLSYHDVDINVRLGATAAVIRHCMLDEFVFLEVTENRRLRSTGCNLHVTVKSGFKETVTALPDKLVRIPVPPTIALRDVVLYIRPLEQRCAYAFDDIDISDIASSSSSRDGILLMLLQRVDGAAGAHATRTRSSHTAPRTASSRRPGGRSRCGV